MSKALDDIATERQRQIDVEGWSLEHDDLHTAGHMAYAAGCYTIGSVTEGKTGMITSYWPWHKSWWKPDNKRRMLIKAGALIIAEIERLDRAEAKQS